MGRVLLASTCFAIIMEIVVLPSFYYLSKDSRWSLLTFVGAFLFLVACSNLLYGVDLCCLTYATSSIGRCACRNRPIATLGIGTAASPTTRCSFCQPLYGDLKDSSEAWHVAMQL